MDARSGGPQRACRCYGRRAKPVRCRSSARQATGAPGGQATGAARPACCCVCQGLGGPRGPCMHAPPGAEGGRSRREQQRRRRRRGPPASRKHALWAFASAAPRHPPIPVPHHAGARGGRRQLQGRRGRGGRGGRGDGRGGCRGRGGRRRGRRGGQGGGGRVGRRGAVHAAQVAGGRRGARRRGAGAGHAGARPWRGRCSRQRWRGLDGRAWRESGAKLNRMQRAQLASHRACNGWSGSLLCPRRRSGPFVGRHRVADSWRALAQGGAAGTRRGPRCTAQAVQPSGLLTALA